MRYPLALTLMLIVPSVGLAGVLEDFEAGSGGIKLTEVDQVVRTFIYAMMCLLVGWVLYSSLRDMAAEGSTEALAITTRIARSLLLCIVVILTIT